jgi:exodeoxyribonuclease-3
VKLATWNINSVRQRQGHVARFLERAAPDLLLLQEIKCEAAMFPAEAFAKLGYRTEAVGQKAYNGVAVLGRVPFTVTARALPGLPAGDAQARYLEVETDGMTIGNLYLPNGNSGGADGFAYKLAWMDRLIERARTLLDADRPIVLAGDFNVCPTDADLAPGALSPNDALIQPDSRARFRSLIWLGLTDALRDLHPNDRVFTFWDYQDAAWPRDSGLRIDHVLLSPTLAERLTSAESERRERAEDQPSDHVPVVVEIG